MFCIIIINIIINNNVSLVFFPYQQTLKYLLSVFLCQQLLDDASNNILSISFDYKILLQYYNKIGN